jgi:hypothetical protein
MASFNRSIILALLALTPSLASAQSSSMGLLFTSPEEREYLDYLREDFLERTASQGFDIQTEEIPQIEAEEIEQNVEFHLDAIITNQDGSHTIWLNGSAVREFDLPDQVDLVHRSGRDMLQISTSTATYLLKPGQTVNLSTGDLWESFESRAAEEQTETSSQGSGGIAQTTPLQTSEPSVVQPPGRPASPPTQGVVAIQDLIEALQMIQSGNIEETSGTSQQ